MIQKQLWFEKANDYRTLHIYLPESYFNSHQEYPVMYFFDGHNLFFDEVATYGTCCFNEQISTIESGLHADKK